MERSIQKNGLINLLILLAVGVAALAVLSNGLVHAREPREAAGVLTGALLLLAAVGGTHLPKILARRRPQSQTGESKTA